MDKYYLNEDTIAAISTAHGIGGIAVIRISGKESFPILTKIFKRINNKSLIEIESHKMYRGFIYNSHNTKIDDVLCIYMKYPGSYTGEDLVEIHSHGGMLIPRLILEQCLFNGARLSNPGEFTYRAYMNGKMDLLQAEAVADVIDSQTETSLKHSLSQLEGRLSNEIDALKNMILDILAEIEANVDFPEDGLDPPIKDTIIRNTEILMDSVNKLLSTYKSGHLIKNGVTAAIIGKPNVGKSSLLNTLIGKNRAIVSNSPGTTRDFIVESVDINGISLNLIDTAGLRTSSNKVEMSGVNITKRKIEQAELLLIVLDSSDELSNEDLRVLKNTKNNKSIIILNKCDLAQRISPSTINQRYKCEVVKISAKHGINIDTLKEQIYNTISENRSISDTNSVCISELRHKVSLEKAMNHLNLFLNQLVKDESPEYLSIDLRSALDSLSEIIGNVSTEELLGKIFSKFCIGK